MPDYCQKLCKAIKGQDQSKIDLLIDKVVDHDRNIWGYGFSPSPLHFAAGFENVEAIEKLIRHGYNIDAYVVRKAHEKVTSLMWAINRGKIESVKVLLSHGIDITLTGTWGSTSGTAMDFAKKRGQKEILTILEQFEAENPHRTEAKMRGDCGLIQELKELITIKIQARENAIMEANVTMEQISLNEEAIQTLKKSEDYMSTEMIEATKKELSELRQKMDKLTIVSAMRLK